MFDNEDTNLFHLVLRKSVNLVVCLMAMFYEANSYHQNVSNENNNIKMYRIKITISKRNDYNNTSL